MFNASSVFKYGKFDKESAIVNQSSEVGRFKLIENPNYSNDWWILDTVGGVIYDYNSKGGIWFSVDLKQQARIQQMSDSVTQEIFQQVSSGLLKNKND